MQQNTTTDLYTAHIKLTYIYNTRQICKREFQFNRIGKKTMNEGVGDGVDILAHSSTGFIFIHIFTQIHIYTHNT